MAKVPRAMRNRTSRLNKYARSVARDLPSNPPVPADESDPRWPAYIYHAQQAQKDRASSGLPVWAGNAYSSETDLGVAVFGTYYDGPPLVDVIGSNATAISISAWTRRTIDAGNSWGGGLIGSTTDYTGKSDGFGFMLTSNAQRDFFINDWAGRRTPPNDFNNTQWVHWAASWDGSEAAADRITIWRNGVEEVLSGAGAISAGPIDVSGTQNLRLLQIGNTSLPTGNEDKWNPGTFDEFSMYSDALTQTDVDYLYNSGTPQDLAGAGAPDNMLAWWRFGDAPLDDPTFDTGLLFDWSGNGHHMTPVKADPSGVIDYIADVP